jgi:hypothetical protein
MLAIGGHEMQFVTKEDEPNNTPHIIGEIGVVEAHGPSLFGRRKGAQHKQTGIFRQKRFKRVQFFQLQFSI